MVFRQSSTPLRGGVIGWLIEGEIDFLLEEERIEPEQYVAAAMVRLLVTAGI